MRRLVGLGIIVLPIHDSFITAARHERTLAETMDLAWAQCFGGEQRIFSMRYDITDPQREGWAGWSSPAVVPVQPPLLVVRLPWGRGADLFGGRACPLPELDAWSSGVAPRAVRAYLRDEIMSRGLRPSDVAHRLGISRPQLAQHPSRAGSGPALV